MFTDLGEAVRGGIAVAFALAAWVALWIALPV